jgi:hypothetical protein
MRKSQLGIIVTIAVLFSLVFPCKVFALDIPLTLYGSLIINGGPAPVGTLVEARGENVRTDVRDNPLTTTQTGQYGSKGINNHLVVQPEIDRTIQQGSIISFYVNGVAADQTFNWGDSHDPAEAFNLTVTIPFSRAETVTNLTSSKNPSIVNRSVTFTAVVSSLTSNSNTPGGLVYFYDGTTPLGGYSLSAGSAAYSTSVLTRGTHIIKAVYTGDTNFSGSEKTFTQTVNSEGGGGGSPITSPTTTTTTTAAATTITTTTTTKPASTTSTTTASSPMKVLDLSQFIDSSGKFLQSFKGESLDGKGIISIPAGTVGKTVDGNILFQITIRQVDNPGGTPAPSASFGMAGLCYDFQPGGALFSQPISIILFYDATKIPAGEKPYIAWWNYASDKWEKQETVSINEGTGTVTTNVTRLGVYAALYSKLNVTSTLITTTAASTPKTNSQSTPIPTPTGTGSSSTGVVVGLIVLFVAVVLIVVYFILKRRSSTKTPK